MFQKTPRWHGHCPGKGNHSPSVRKVKKVFFCPDLYFETNNHPDGSSSAYHVYAGTSRHLLRLYVRIFGDVFDRPHKSWEFK